MRDPAIHIKRSELKRIVLPYGLTAQDVDRIMQAATKCTLRNRVFISATAKAKKKLDRITGSEVNMDDFTRIYMGVILSNDIKSLTIHKGDPQYITFKEIAGQAKEFCDMFEISYEEGYKQYIQFGVNLLKQKFSLYRLKGYGPRIVDHYKDLLFISEDPTPEQTAKMYQTWVKVVGKYFGSTVDTGKNIAVYAHFVHAKNDAESVGARYFDWLCAQFEKWSYLNSIPDFSQLHGDNAKLIYNMYMAKNHKDDSYFKAVKDEKAIPLKTVEQEKSTREARIRQSLQRTGSDSNGE